MTTFFKECGHFFKEGVDTMGKRSRRGKLNWRSKKANHGRKPCLGHG